MIKPPAVPAGLMRYEELLNILLALAMAGCDLSTLAIVAQAAGVREHFDHYVGLDAPSPVLAHRRANELLREHNGK